MTRKAVPSPQPAFETPQLYVQYEGVEFVIDELRPDVRDAMLAASALHAAKQKDAGEAAAPQPNADEAKPKDAQENVAAMTLQLMIEFPAPEQLDPIDDNKQAAFGRYTKRELHEKRVNFDPSLITPELAEYMTPDSLYGVFYPDRTLPGQKGPKGQYIKGILLNNYEYELIPRSLEALGTSARAKFLNKKNTIDGTVVDSSERYRMHLYEDGIIPSLTKHQSLLQERQEEIRGLLMMAKNPGMRRFKSGTVKEMMAHAWQELDNIVDVLHVHEGWTQEQREGAEAVILRTLITGQSKDRVAGWKSWLGFVDKYLTTRIHLLATTARETQDAHTKLAAEYAENRPA